jgi:nucleoside-diphosphate-sugar epimerase
VAKKVFVLGAGQIGFAIARRFAIFGWDVTIASRSGSLDAELAREGVNFAALDRESDDQLQHGLSPGADLFVDTIAYKERHALQLLPLARIVGHFIVISSASVYRDKEGRTLDESTGPSDFPHMPVPIAEGQPTVALSDQNYSTRKALVEQILLQRSASPVAILRPCAVYGLRTRHPREWWFVKRALDGRRHTPLAFEGHSRFHTSATDNIAEVARIAAEVRFHGALNIADPDALSVIEIGKVIAAILNWDWTPVLLNDAASQTPVGSTPWSVPRPFILDTAKARDLGYKPVLDYPNAAAPYVRWLADAAASGDWHVTFPGLAPYRFDEMFDYEAEDRFLKALGS